MIPFLLAISLQLDYFANGQARQISITDPVRVKEVLSTIKVLGQRAGEELPLYPSNTVTFHFAEGPSVTGHFVSDTMIYFPGKGLVGAEPSFYQTLTKLASTKENLNVDILHSTP